MSVSASGRATPSSPLVRKLVLGILLLFLVPTLVLAGLLAMLYRRGVFADPFALLLALLIGLAVLMAYLAVVTYSIGRVLVRTVHEIQLGTELMATVNPDHRLDVRTRDELQALADAVNRMADRARQALDEREGAVAGATVALELERRNLSAILETLGEALVVTAPDGRIILANRLARQLLGDAPTALLGRSFFDLVDREQAAPIVKRLGTGAGPAERFTLRTRAGALLEVVMTPLVDDDGVPAGMVLVVRDVARVAGPEGGAGTSATPEGGGMPRVRFVGAGLSTGAGARDVPRERPDFYDFSLADTMTRELPPADRQRRLDQLTCAVVDVETTGLAADGDDRIVSIAAVRVRNGTIRRGEMLDVLVNPGRLIPAASVRFHGITDAAVAGAPPVAAVLPATLGFLEDAVVVGHQVWFDLRFLHSAAARAGLPPLVPGHAVLDTLVLSQIVHGVLEGHGLDEVAARLGVAVRGRHSALGDALATAEVFVRLVELLKHRGIYTLGQALDAGRRIRRAPGPR